MQNRTDKPKNQRTKKHPKLTKKDSLFHKLSFAYFTQTFSSIGRPFTFILLIVLKTISIFLTPNPIKSSSTKKFFKLQQKFFLKKTKHLAHRSKQTNHTFQIYFKLVNTKTIHHFKHLIAQIKFQLNLYHYTYLYTLRQLRNISFPSLTRQLNFPTFTFPNIKNFSTKLPSLTQKTAKTKSSTHKFAVPKLPRINFKPLTITKKIPTINYSSPIFSNFISLLHQKYLSTISSLTSQLKFPPLYSIAKRTTTQTHSWFNHTSKKITRTFHRTRLQANKDLSKTARFIQKFISQLSTSAKHILSTPIHATHHTLTKHRKVSLSILGVLSIFTVISITTYYFYQNILKDLPNPTALAHHSPSLSTKIFDRHGNLLYKIYKNENRSLVTLADIPIHLQLATIAIEDQDFYEHSGISLPGIIRALKVNTTSDKVEGGSTITQQLIKNTLLTPEKTYVRKIKEALLSVMVEFFFTKDEILTMYFNQVAYGGATYGIQEAARMYFHKEVSELNLAESSFLAGLPAAPTYYSPYGTQPEQAKARQSQVLRRMVEEGYISQAKATMALGQTLNIHPHQNPIYAPHFVMYVKDYLANIYGHRMVEQGGLEVTTSLDLDVQNQVQSVVTDEVNKLLRLNIKNGASIVTIPKTGEVLAMVGSIDYFDRANDGQVNVTIRSRQPGSSIKPINYANALENGFTPATIIPDTAICYNTKGQPPYCPKNYDGRYHGNVTLRKALANSYNIPAVKTLFQFGVDNMIHKAELMGITTWGDTNRFGLALTLGGGEVKMTDMAVAYGTFSNNGIRVDLNPVLEVRDATGEIIYTSCHTHPNLPDKASAPCPGTRALDPRVAYQITDILSDNQARTPAFGAHSVLEIPGQQVAVKTGTTNSMRDNWTIGYTSDYLVATWVGNNDNTPMSYVASGITGASPIWSKIITQFLDPQHPHAFAPPGNLTKVAICQITGTLSCNGCPTKEEYFLPGTEPTKSCTPDTIAKITNPTPPNPQPPAN